jgi:hypothetical protein
MTINLQATTTLSNGVKMPWLGLGVFKVEEGPELVNAVKYAINKSKALLKLEAPLFYIFLTYSDFKLMAPKPSILQSILWSPSTKRMFFTFVPCFSVEELPFTLRSLITVTVSPSLNTLPFASLITLSSSTEAVSKLHS